MLTAEAQDILEVLVEHLQRVTPGQPQTYLGYKQVHDQVGLDMMASTYGDSLKRQGLQELAQWTIDSRFPGVTGIVIDQTTYLPGRGYFSIFGRENEDYVWWNDQVERSKSFDWSGRLNFQVHQSR